MKTVNLFKLYEEKSSVLFKKIDRTVESTGLIVTCCIRTALARLGLQSIKMIVKNRCMLIENTNVRSCHIMKAFQ